MGILYFLLYCINLSLGSENKTRTVGGELVTNRSAYSYIVSIQMDGRYICGGSILDSKHILTTARCCVNREPKDMLIQAGDKSTTNATLLRKVDEILVHPLYIPFTRKNNIAIIKILGDFPSWNIDIQPVSLISVKPSAGAECKVIGWNITEYDGVNESFQLRSVNVSIIGNSLCSKIFKHHIPEGTLCAGNHGKSWCQGDYGGPLVCGSEQLLAGVASWGRHCEEYPASVYTSVADYTSWINEYMNSSTHAIAANISTTAPTIAIRSPPTYFGDEYARHTRPEHTDANWSPSSGLCFNCFTYKYKHYYYIPVPFGLLIMVIICGGCRSKRNK